MSENSASQPAVHVSDADGLDAWVWSCALTSLIHARTHVQAASADGAVWTGRRGGGQGE